MTVKDSLVYMDGVSEEDSDGDRYLNLASLIPIQHLFFSYANILWQQINELFTHKIYIFQYSSGPEEASEAAHSADKLLSGWFCFVQTEEGKVVAIYHSKADHPSAVNLKKSIAAAFQANFKGTDTEEEVDLQSIHISHYRYM